MGWDGAGRYAHQVLATKRSMPSWGFGRATRDEVRKTVDGMFNKDFQYAAEYPRPSPGAPLPLPVLTQLCCVRLSALPMRSEHQQQQPHGGTLTTAADRTLTSWRGEGVGWSQGRRGAGMRAPWVGRWRGERGRTHRGLRRWTGASAAVWGTNHQAIVFLRPVSMTFRGPTASSH
jgi:hypothetical protein